MSSCAELLDQLGPPGHVVQLYGQDDRLLTQNVGRFLLEGLKRGDGLLVIATTEHRGTLVRQLKEERGYAQAVLEGRLVFLDAEATLARFMVDGSPDPDLFQRVVGEALSGVQARSVHTGVRAFGELVGLLWQAGQQSAASRLEDLWNKLLGANQVSLFCAYPIDVFGPEFRVANLDAVLCAHSPFAAGGYYADKGVGPGDGRGARRQSGRSPAADSGQSPAVLGRNTEGGIAGALAAKQPSRLGRADPAIGASILSDGSHRNRLIPLISAKK
jgi:hypothetical protein